MRFSVFNLEMNRGLDSSYRSGRDVDVHDAACHHLLVRWVETEEIVGTYRLNCEQMVGRHRGFYSASEFDLGALPRSVLAGGVEIGRACIAREHRNGRVLHLLWQGLARYAAFNRKRYMFGCCSVDSQDAIFARRLMNDLEAKGYRHPTFEVVPLRGLEAYPEDLEVEQESCGSQAARVGLLDHYLRLGAKICGPPMIDRRFKTIDFFVMLDLHSLAPSALRRYFGA